MDGNDDLKAGPASLSSIDRQLFGPSIFNRFWIVRFFNRSFFESSTFGFHTPSTLNLLKNQVRFMAVHFQSFGLSPGTVHFDP